MQDEFHKNEIRSLRSELQSSKLSLTDLDIKYQNRINEALLYLDVD